MKEIKKSSKQIIDFIDSFTLFANFNEKINKYINDLNYKNGLSENIIKKNADNYEELSTKLYELNILSLKYYDKANSTYNELKEFIIKKIKLINKLIEKCSNITYEVIINKYIDIKNKFNPVTKKFEEEKDSIIVDSYEEKAGDELSYTIKTKVQNFLVNNEFILDIIIEEESKLPKLIGKIINKNRPKNFEIDIYSPDGQLCGKIGRRIFAEFSNVSLVSNIELNSGLNYATIKNNFNNEEYNIKTKFYQSEEYSEVIVIAGIPFEIPEGCIEKDRETPENEKDSEIIPLEKKTENKKLTLNNNIFEIYK